MINGFGYDLLFDFNTHTLHQHVIKFSKEICTSKIFLGSNEIIAGESKLWPENMLGEAILG